MCLSTNSVMPFKNIGVHRVEKHPYHPQSASDLQMRVSSNHSLGEPRKAENTSARGKDTKRKGLYDFPRQFSQEELSNQIHVLWLRRG